MSVRTQQTERRFQIAAGRQDDGAIGDRNAHRQRRIRLTRPAEAAQPAGSDWIAIAIAVVIVLVAAGYSLRHIP